MNLKLNQLVRLHPATDLFMKGVVYATIKSIGKKWITLCHDWSNTTHRISMDDKGEMLFGQNS